MHYSIEYWTNWGKAAGIRALKTVAQASIAAIGAAVGLILGAVQVHRASAALTRAAVDLNVIDEVCCHKIYFFDSRSTIRMICRNTSAMV